MNLEPKGFLGAVILFGMPTIVALFIASGIGWSTSEHEHKYVKHQRISAGDTYERSELNTP